MNKLSVYLSQKKDKIIPFVRFCIVGIIASLLHYVIYWLLLKQDVEVNISYSAGYIISFVCNFFATNYFTFRTKPTWTKFLGFAGSHGINYIIHVVLLNFVLWIGVHKLVAPVIVMVVAMLVQFSILRLVFRKK